MQALGDGLLKSDSGHTTNQSVFVSLIGCMFIQLHTTVLSAFVAAAREDIRQILGSELGISLAVLGYLNLKSQSLL